MTPGQIAALIVAGSFALLVLILAIPLIKLGRTLDEATIALRKAHENSEPLLTNANATIGHVNSQLKRVDVITADARAVTGNVSVLTSLFTATLGGPLVKAAALSYGVSRALRRRRRTKALDEPGNGRHSRSGRTSRRGGRR